MLEILVVVREHVRFRSELAEAKNHVESTWDRRHYGKRKVASSLVWSVGKTLFEFRATFFVFLRVRIIRR